MSEHNLSEERVREEVRQRVADISEMDLEEVTDTALFAEDLGVDSLMAIELLVALDKEYGIDLPEEQFRQIRTLNEAVDVIMKQLTNGDHSSQPG